MVPIIIVLINLKYHFKFALSISFWAFLLSSSSETAECTHFLFTGFKYVPNDFATTNAAGIPIILINKPTTWNAPKIARINPKGKYSTMTIVEYVFHTGFCSTLSSFLLIIVLPNGQNRNFPNSISPTPIGAAITVMVKTKPSMYTHIALTKPKKGICHKMLPSVFIFFLLFVG